MIYNNFDELKLSSLGLGAMRLPTVDGIIDEAKARELIEYAYGNGINYFDTAYGYHSGASEAFLTSVLHQYPRESWYIASKMPGHMMQYKNGKIEGLGYMAGETIESLAQIFEKQLERCKVDYFDFYLLHNICETAYDFYTDQELRVSEYLLEQKKLGRIRHLGISAHGRAETIDKFLSTTPGIEFVQLQLNYMDWTLQDAKKKYEVVTKHGLPIVVMEPVRGGMLASLSADADAMLKSSRPNDSTVSWAFRYLQSLPNVPVVLSGMTTMDQLKENIELFSKHDPTTEQDHMLFNKVVDTLLDSVPCTACEYCLEACPQKLHISKLISIFNEMRFGGSFATELFTLNAMNQEELPSACIECGECNKLCPQEIDVPAVLKDFCDILTAKTAGGSK